MKMKVVALISGGKDSTFNMMQCIAAGHEIVALANLIPHSQTEIDSYMYQSVGYEAINLIASAMDLPLFRKATHGISNNKEKIYTPSENDEVEDLYELLKEIQSQFEFDAVSVGAILSDYQRVRVEHVCIRLGLTPLAYLWQRDQDKLLDEMIKCEVDAVIVKVAALGLEPLKHLGKSLTLLQPHLRAMHDKYGLNICGEGGEYETITLDCPLFRSRIIIKESEIVMHSNDTIAPVGYLKLNKLELELKLPPLDLESRLAGLPLKDSNGYVTDDADAVVPENFEDDDDVDAQDVVTLGGIKSDTFQKCCSFSSGEGWLWIGGIQGTSADPNDAMIEAMNVLKSVLDESEHSVRDVCSISMFISDMSQYAQLNKVYVDTFNHVNPPSRACVEVPFDIKCPVRIEALSWKRPLNMIGDLNSERLTMHVQSRSHWAPASIGPYSQAVQISKFIHLAGQIGLVPGTLELVSGGIRQQCRLALRHIGRLLKAVDSNVNIRDVVQGICYVTDVSYIAPARKLWEGKTNNAIVDYVVVTGLPKNALIEWHVWAHKYNNQFEYGEIGTCVGSYGISLYRRVNYENNLAAVVCRVENIEDVDNFDFNIFVEALTYAIRKLKQGHENDLNSVYNLKIFYVVAKIIRADFMVNFLDEYKDNDDIRLVYTLVPVVHLNNEDTFFSICGVRNQ